MVLSSSFGGCWRGRRIGPVVAQKCPQDVDAASGERNDGLVVGARVLAFLEVVIPAGPLAHHAGLRREGKHAAQRAAVTAGGSSGAAPAGAGGWGGGHT